MPKILFLGVGQGKSKWYIAKALVTQGYELVALTERVPSWIAPSLLYGESVDVAGAGAADYAVTMAREFGVDGVFTCDEAYVELVAEVAGRLGLPGLSRRTAMLCRDKHAMRQRLAQAGIPSPRSIAVGTLTEAYEAAAVIGYPVVLKPRNLAGSIGVVRADGPGDIKRYFAVASEAGISRITSLSGVLVEDYLDGPEFSVESVAAGGVVTVCGITEKMLGFAPFFEETGHIARPVDQENPLDARLVEVTRGVHAALGIAAGVTCCEVRVTADGPHIVEIAGRVGGDQIPVITKLATGIDLIAAAGAVATGAQPDLRPVMARAAGIRMVYPRDEGSITRLDASRIPSGLLQDIGWYAEVGQSVLLPPRRFLSRLAYLVAAGDTRREVMRRLDEAEAALDIEIAPGGTPSISPRVSAPPAAETGS